MLIHDERLGMYPAPREQRRAIRPASIRLGAPEHHRIQAVPVFQHVLWAGEQRRVEQLHQHPELKVVALVRGCRQKHQITRMVLERLGKLVVLRFADLATRTIGSEVMRLVKHHQVPARRLEQPLDACWPLQSVNARDQPVVL